jgi:hypothetical protein
MDSGGTPQAPVAVRRGGAGWTRLGWQEWGIVLCLGGSAFALALAPLLMPDSYSWVSHTTSESAAQGVSGAWLARLGFLVFGLVVLWLAAFAGARWGRWGRLFHGMFGVLMAATAAFSHRPFEPGIMFDRTEDLLHSVTATAMGFAFAIGVVAVMVSRPGRLTSRHALDAAALVASVVIPLSMVAWSRNAGLLQRSMFLVAYLWYGTEALDTTGRRSTSPTG